MKRFMRVVAAAVAATAALLAGCGNIEESEPKPRLDAVSTPGTSFGSTLVDTRKRLDFRLRNSDAGLPKVKPLQGIVPGVSGAGLTLSHTCPAELKEGEECYLAVYYQPSAAGTLSGELRVTSDSGALALPLSGTALAALSPAAGVVAFAGTPDSSFGTVSRGSSKTLSYVVTNIGNAADAISITGPSGGGWSYAQDCPDTLAVGASCNLSVTFAPTVSGISVPTPLLVKDAYNAEYGGLALAVSGSGS